MKKEMKNRKLKIIEILIGVTAIIMPFIIAAKTVFAGNFPFWYDPARDFLQGIDNLHKLTLIGPTSGIPGIFYGPYWIWLISFGLLFSHDPRVVIFIIATLPYFVILPIILYQFREIFSFTGCIIIWLLLIFSTGQRYATNAWNPHPAPLLFSILIYLIIFIPVAQKRYIKYLWYLLIGIVTGLILNFHISFGLCIAVGLFIFFLISFGREIFFDKKRLKINLINHLSVVIVTGCGILLTFLPFFLFEIRHGFNQMHTAIKVLATHGSVVNVKGLSKMQILQNFFGTIGEVLKLELNYVYAFFIGTIGYVSYQIKKGKIKFNDLEIRLIQFLLSVIVSLLFLYLTSKNPVWSYHFIGVEIIFLFMIGVVIGKIKVLRIILGLWILIILILNSSGMVASFYQDPLKSSASLTAKKHIVNLIINDTGKNDFILYAYSPSIYYYEYSYLFRWLDNKYVPYDPGMNHANSSTVYLIIPPVTSEIKNNFVNYRTSEKSYSTKKEWKNPDGTTILKRQKIIN